MNWSLDRCSCMSTTSFTYLLPRHRCKLLACCDRGSLGERRLASKDSLLFTFGWAKWIQPMSTSSSGNFLYKDNIIKLFTDKNKCIGSYGSNFGKVGGWVGRSGVGKWRNVLSDNRTFISYISWSRIPKPRSLWNPFASNAIPQKMFSFCVVVENNRNGTWQNSQNYPKFGFMLPPSIFARQFFQQTLQKDYFKYRIYIEPAHRDNASPTQNSDAKWVLFEMKLEEKLNYISLYVQYLTF